MKVKVRHKECFARHCQNVQESRKTDQKTWNQINCSFCWVEGGRYRRSWLVACCRLESAERFQIRGAEQERMKWLKRVPYDECDAPAFCAGPPCRAGEGEVRVPRRSQVVDLGLVTGRAQPGLRQKHDVDVVLNEGGYVGPPPGSADGSCIEEVDKGCVFG